MPNRSTTGCSAGRISERSSPKPASSNSIRWKNAPCAPPGPSASSTCCSAWRMLPWLRAITSATAATTPGRSAHDSSSTALGRPRREGSGGGDGVALGGLMSPGMLARSLRRHRTGGGQIRRARRGGPPRRSDVHAAAPVRAHVRRVARRGGTVPAARDPRGGATCSPRRSRSRSGSPTRRRTCSCPATPGRGTCAGTATRSPSDAASIPTPISAWRATTRPR